MGRGDERIAVRWLAEVHVALRPGIADPEGLTIADGLRSLGFTSVEEVRHGKLLQIAFEAADAGAARDLVHGMCRRLLANPVMEVATFEVRAAEEQSEERRIS